MDSSKAMAAYYLEPMMDFKGERRGYTLMKINHGYGILPSCICSVESPEAAKKAIEEFEKKIWLDAKGEVM